MFKMKNEIQDVKHDISLASLRHVTTFLMFMVLSSCSISSGSQFCVYLNKIHMKIICECHMHKGNENALLEGQLPI